MLRSEFWFHEKIMSMFLQYSPSVSHKKPRGKLSTSINYIAFQQKTFDHTSTSTVQVYMLKGPLKLEKRSFILTVIILNPT